MVQTLQQRSRLLRMGIGIVLVLTALTVVGLIFESINVAQRSPDRDWDLRILRLALLGVANLIFAAFLASIGALFFWARASRTLPDLQGWHLDSPPSEFRCSDAGEGYTLADYRKQEERVFQELDQYVSQVWSKQFRARYSRFQPSSICNPNRILDHNWNRTHVLEADQPVGGVLLLHGLSDSPYSLRATGQRLHAEGYTVVWLRVPGHGTNPRALAEVTCHDWTAAVQVAMKGLRTLVPPGKPLVLAGYSNGGALSLHGALCAIDDPELPRADAIVLFSPMIGINPLAKMTRLYHAAGLVSRDPKTKWSNIYAEIDPFKYSSWPMNASVQAWSVTKSVEKKLAALEKSGRMHELPPVLAMQSVVDSTVAVPKLITVLFDRLTTEASELFLFDVNRVDGLCNLLNLSFENSVKPKLQRNDRSFRLTLLGNASQDSPQVSLRIREQDQWNEQPLDLFWPEGVVSLSHVAVPFPPDDPIYGEPNEESGFSLGNLTMRAEPNALMVPSSLFVRCRRNPFYQLMEDRVVEWLSQNL